MFSLSKGAAIGSLLIALVLVPPQALGQNNQERDDSSALMHEAIAAMRQAAERSKKAEYPSSTLPTDPLLRAEELMKAGKNEQALEAVNEAILAEPKRGRLYVLRSGILGNLQHYEEGLADADLGLKLSTTPQGKAGAAYNKGFNLASLDRKADALEAYRLSIQFDPHYEMAHFGKGKLYYALSMWPESKAALSEALKLDPMHGAAWAYLAEVQFKLGQVAEGVASADRSIQFAPNDPRSYRARAIGHQLNRRFENMLADATYVLKLDPTRPQGHLLRGKALGLLGRYEEALAEYALETDRKAVEPYMNGIHRELYGSRIENCGDYSTDIQTPSNFNSDGFTDCSRRVNEQLDEMVKTLEALPTPKRTVPGLPTKRSPTKIVPKP
jgi:tetratricopeptide (TPR) repeat protein